MVFSGTLVFVDFERRTFLGLNVGPFYDQNGINDYRVVKVPRGTLGIDRKVGN